MELRKILTEMGSEPFEPEEADEVINEISFDESGAVSQEGNNISHVYICTTVGCFDR